jgi:hypothetical protein
MLRTPVKIVLLRSDINGYNEKHKSVLKNRIMIHLYVHIDCKEGEISLNLYYILFSQYLFVNIFVL